LASLNPGPIQRAFTTYLESPEVLGAALYLERDGEVLLDCWGGNLDAARTRPWQRDTRTFLASTGKMAAALCVLHLVDRNRLGLDLPVSEVWPEFGHAGKGAITVRQVLTHQAGLVVFDPPRYDCFTDPPAMVRALEQQAPNYEPGTRLMYHTATYWFLCGEIVRRVSGIPMPQYWRREVVADTGMEFTLDVQDEELDRLAPTVVPEDDPLTEPLNDESTLMGQAWRVLRPRAGRVDQATAWNAPATRINGVSGFGNARGLAAMCRLLVNGGTEGKRQVFSRPMATRVLEPQVDAVEHLLDVPVRLGLACWLNGGAFDLVGNPRAFFALGAGGHMGLGDPDRRIAFGFCVNRHEGRSFDQIPPVAAALAAIRAVSVPLGL
jgi:CubicO group peptidase (beta-lactamase class C family)